MGIADMVITRIWFSGRQSKSVNIFLQQLDLGSQKSAQCHKTEENQIPIYRANPNTLGIWVSLARYPSPELRG
jgi:hypothetical protein